ncbi:MAG: aspartate aminotransferase [Candidatus Binatia bacterium]|jgi:aspartate aminotransferase
MNNQCDHSPAAELNPNVRGLKPSATVAINERSNQLIAEGRKIYKLGLGQSPFPVPDCVVAELQRQAHQKDYLPVRGLPALREAVADHHRRFYGIECSARNVIVGPGSKELMFLLQLVYNGELIIPTPAWVSYEPQARIIGREVRLVQTTMEAGYQITAAQLEGICAEDPNRPRILVLNDPSNPTGRTYSKAELQAIADVAHKYRVVVLSDEIYGKLHHEGEHVSIVPMYPEGTIFSGGLSKWCGAGGWRLGVFVVPDCMTWLLDAMAAVASETFTSTCAPIQYAAVTAFKKSMEIRAYLKHCRRVLKALGNRLADDLRAADVDVLSPEGGFYLFPDFSKHAATLAKIGITTSAEFCERLLNDSGVAVLPGGDFGRPAEELTARLAYVNFDGRAALDAAIEFEDDQPLDAAFLEEYCFEPIEAVRLMCVWLAKNLAV